MAGLEGAGDMAGLHGSADMLGLRGTVALVSGASQGIGHAVAARLLQAGCRVALADLDADRTATAAAALGELDRCRGWALDVRDRAACLAVAAEVARTWGPIGVLVNNAGIGGSGAVLADGGVAEDIDRVMAVNVKGILHLVEACTEDLRRTRGAIVNVASITTLVATRANIAYGASKGAVGQLTRFLARDFGPHGVRVNAVAPGLVMTPMTQAIARDGDRMGMMVGRTLLRRAGEPDDIAGPVAFLASPLARYMTGAIVPVDGGYTAN